MFHKKNTHTQTKTVKTILIPTLLLALCLTENAQAGQQGTKVDICNDTLDDVKIGIASYRNQEFGFGTQGWDSVQAGSCREYNYLTEDSKVYRGDIYVYAKTATQNMVTGYRKFCVSKNADSVFNDIYEKSTEYCGDDGLTEFVNMKGAAIKPGIKKNVVRIDDDDFILPSPLKPRLVKVDAWSPVLLLLMPDETIQDGAGNPRQLWRQFKIECSGNTCDLYRDAAEYLGLDVSDIEVIPFGDPTIKLDFQYTYLIDSNNPTLKIGANRDAVRLYVDRQGTDYQYFLWFRNQNNKIIDHTLYQTTCKGIIDMLGFDIHDAMENDPRGLPFIKQDVIEIGCVNGEKPETLADWCSQRSMLTPDALRTVNALVDYAKKEDNRVTTCEEASQWYLATKKEHRKIEHIDLPNQGISDLRPLSSFSWLKSLNLSHNTIRDLTPLVQMNKLMRVNLSYNSIREVEVLGSLGELGWVVLNDNDIKDISPLKGLENIREVQIKNNGLSQQDCPFDDATVCVF